MKFLPIGTLIVIVFLLIFFAIGLYVTQNEKDLGYCPSNVFGFDPENPHRSYFYYLIFLNFFLKIC